MYHLTLKMLSLTRINAYAKAAQPDLTQAQVLLHRTSHAEGALHPSSSSGQQHDELLKMFEYVRWAGWLDLTINIYPILIWIFLGSGTINIYKVVQENAEDRQDPFPTLVVEACGGHSRRLGKQIKIIQNIFKININRWFQDDIFASQDSQNRAVPALETISFPSLGLVTMLSFELGLIRHDWFSSMHWNFEKQLQKNRTQCIEGRQQPMALAKTSIQKKRLRV